MIGSWQDSAILAAVAATLWAGAFGWYAIGTDRIKAWFRSVRARPSRAAERQAKPAAKRPRRASAAPRS